MVSITTDPIKCLNCNRNLRPPFKVCTEVHIVCSRCGGHLEDGHSPNTATLAPSCLGTEVNCEYLNSYYKNMLDFCTHNCGYQDTLDAVLCHENTCSSKICTAVCILQSCDWTGKITELIKHAVEVHPAAVFVYFQQPNKYVEVELDSQMILLFDPLYYRNEIYWLTLRDGFLVVQFVGHVGEKPTRLLGQETFSICSSTSRKRAEGLVAPSTTKDLQETRKHYSVNVSWVGESLRLTFPDLEAGVQQVVECSICTEEMSLPIRQCNTGHSLCDRCYMRLETKICPTCKSIISNTRNYALEEIVEKNHVTCANYVIGCREKGQLQTMKEHIKVCCFTTSKCIYETCRWSGVLHSFKDHLLQLHKTFQVTNNTFFEQHTAKCQRVYSSYVTLYDRTFFIRQVVMDDDVRYALNVVYVTQEAFSEYVYEVELRHMKKQISIMFGNPCVAVKHLEEYFEMKKPFFSMAYETFEMFLNNGVYRMKINIRRLPADINN